MAVVIARGMGEAKNVLQVVSHLHWGEGGCQSPLQVHLQNYVKRHRLIFTQYEGALGLRRSAAKLLGSNRFCMLNSSFHPSLAIVASERLVVLAGDAPHAHSRKEAASAGVSAK